MPTPLTIAELLIEIGLDVDEANRAAKKIANNLEKVKKSAKKVDKEATKAEKSLKRLGKASKIAGKFARGLAIAMLGVAGVVVGVGKKVLDIGGRFESLAVQLKTTTGSAEAAEKALAFIKEFAKNTPFQVEEITQAFVKLNNFGIEPTTKALTAFGDFAAAFGKTLDQVVEAVTDATTGEFERLKEFGIKASSEGDRVKFTFRGITTEVGKNAKEIQAFLTGIAETNFGGAMAEQMTTLGGLTSNLQDAMADFFDSVARMGPLEEFKLLIGDLRDATAGSGGLAQALARTLTTAIKGIRRLISGNFIPTLERLLSVIEFMVDNFGKLAALFIAAKLVSGIATLQIALTGMGLSLAALVNPVTIIAAGIAGIAAAAIIATDALLDLQAAKLKALGGPRAEQRGQLATPAQRKAAEQRASQDLGTLPGEDLPIRASELGGLTTKELKFLRTQSERTRLGTVGTEEGAIALETLRTQQRLITDELKTRERERRAASTVALETSARARARPRKRGKKARTKAEKKEKEVVGRVPTTVSEFFSAAARGELGPIAERTPSPREIEPTVAVDITNNNFAFKDTFNISGVTDPEETGKQVVAKIKLEFDKRLASAGQQLQSNLVR